MSSEHIPLCVPNTSGNELSYVTRCLEDGWVSTAGSFVTRFEDEFAIAVGAQHAVTTTSGTAALHIALLLSSIGRDDEVVVPALTFIAPANAVRYVGAWPVFLDVDPKHGLLSVEALTAFLENGCENRHGVPHNRATGRPVRGVISVDILGHPSDLTAISEVAARHGVAVIEDATESLGATIGGVRLGGIAPITAFSFNGNKLLTTGGGGMLTTNDDRIADRARYLTTQAKDDPIEYVHNEIGYNYRLTNLQAAVGVAQLERLDEFISSKLSIARRYRQAFEALPDLGLIEGPPWGNSMYWLATASLHPESKVSSRALLRLLESSNIQTRPLWQPLHRSPAHAGSWASPCPYAEDLAARSLSLPSSTHLSPDDQDRVIEAVVQALA